MKRSLLIACLTILFIPATTMPMANFARMAVARTVGLLRNKPVKFLATAGVVGTTAAATQQEAKPALLNRTDLVIQNMAWIKHKADQYPVEQRARVIPNEEQRIYPVYWNTRTVGEKSGEYVDSYEYYEKTSNLDIQTVELDTHKNKALIKSTFMRTRKLSFGDNPLLHDFAPVTWWQWISRAPKQITTDDSFTQCKGKDHYVTCTTEMSLKDLYNRFDIELEITKQRAAHAKKDQEKDSQQAIG